MSDIKSSVKVLDDKLAFSPQLAPSDLTYFADLGYEMLICNRPDGESEQQPSIDSIRKAAESLGMIVIFAPVINNEFTPAVVSKTEQALARNKKTLMFCRTGTRSTILWLISQLHHEVDSEILFEQAARLGYELHDKKAAINYWVEQLTL